MGKYRGKNFNPNHKKQNKIVALSNEKEKPLQYGEQAKPFSNGVLFEDGAYVNLGYLEGAIDDLTFEEIEMIDNDPVVGSQREKLLQTAASQKSSYDFNDVDQVVTDFATELKNSIDWESYHRHAHSSTKYGYSVIQVLWEDVDYEIIGEKIYPKTQRIYGFKHEDYRDFYFNTDKNSGKIGDVIHAPTRTNITRDYPYNFIVIKNKPDFLYPEGVSDLKQLKTIIDLKRFMIKVQARYAKKAAIPAFVAIYRSDKKGDELTTEAQGVADNLKGIENGSGIALPNIDNVVALMPVNQVDFIKVISYLDSIIFLRVLGTSLLGGQSEKGGSYASAKVGEKELENAVKATALTLQAADNIVIKYAVWQRFGSDAKIPKILFDLTEKASIEEFTFMRDSYIPVDYDEILKVFPVAAGVQEPEDKKWYLGSPDGTLASMRLDNKSKEGENPENIPEEKLLKKDADRKQDEEDVKLKKINE